MMSETAVSIHSLSRSFSGKRAVNSLEFDIQRGSVFGFLGPNGAGKTTTIRLLLGLLAPDSGNATVLGHDIINESHLIREKTGALLEHNGLYERISVQANLDLYGRIYHLEDRERHDRIEGLLERFDLTEKAKERTGSLSRGMKQKLAVARALLHRPPLIFLDEPTAGLDPVASSQLRNTLRDLVATEGITVFLTTHNLMEAEQICDTVGVIRKGELIAFGPPSTLTSSKDNIYLVRGSGFSENILSNLNMLPMISDVTIEDSSHINIHLTADNTMAPIVRKIIESGAEIEEVRKETNSLEDSFLALLKDGSSDRSQL